MATIPTKLARLERGTIQDIAEILRDSRKAHERAAGAIESMSAAIQELLRLALEDIVRQKPTPPPAQG